MVNDMLRQPSVLAGLKQILVSVRKYKDNDMLSDRGIL